MTDSKLEYYFNQVIAEGVESALVDVQVLLQLLIKKGIISKEEVDETRKIVRSNSDTIKGIRFIIDRVESKHNKEEELKNIFRKLKNGDSLTEEERKNVLNINLIN